MICIFLVQAVSVSAKCTPISTIADTSYISDYSNNLCLRVYGSHKFNRFNYGENQETKLEYKPNSNYNIGVGFNYKSIGLNLGFVTPFVNNDNSLRGKTRHFDGQGYVYQRKYTINFYVQDFKGYYLSSTAAVPPSLNGASFRIRPDIRTSHLGLDYDQLFNGKRFSYRATYLQNEWQRKSAGSFIAGAGFHYYRIHADSALIPEDLINAPILVSNRFHLSNRYELNIHAGYAHTFVYKQHWFMTLGVTAGPSLGYNLFTTDINNRKENYAVLTPNISCVGRAGLGYNSESWYAGIYYTSNRTQFGSGGSLHTNQLTETGVLRVAIVKRMILKNGIKVLGRQF